MVAPTERTPLIPPHKKPPLPIPFEDVAPVNDSRNVLLLYRLNLFYTKSYVNFFLAILCLVYVGINFACLVINTKSEEYREAHMSLFHRMEFWGTFMFSLVDVFSIVYSPKPLGRICENPFALKLFIFLNVTASLIPAILITADMEEFEVVSHEIEYANELTMVLIDLVILISLVNESAHTSASTGISSWMVAVSGMVCVLQLGLYNLLPPAAAEQIPHFLEFVFEIFSAGTLFWFCMDNKVLADMRISNILIHGVCFSNCYCVQETHRNPVTGSDHQVLNRVCDNEGHDHQILHEAVSVDPCGAV
jgi:hypothetical protein